MLVDDKLAKEKLISELQTQGFIFHIYRSRMAKLIRNTDLTDCQPQPMENMSVTQAGNDPSATPSGTPTTDAEAFWIRQDEDRKQYQGNEYVRACIARQLERKLNAKQAKIDALMLEYCPDEMTGDQIEEWGRHQMPTVPFEPTDSMLRAGRSALRKHHAKHQQLSQIMSQIRMVYKAMEAARTTEGNARESARDAGSDINKELVASDQGSVRNATDMRERCARVCEDLALAGMEKAKRIGRVNRAECLEIARIEHCALLAAAAAIRALPDQKD